MFFRSILRKSKIFRGDHLLRVAGGDGIQKFRTMRTLGSFNIIDVGQLEWNARPLCAVIMPKLR
jgi:hypothetical protein